jgi:glutathione synthase/RimK-type ligase-like ATP-grasp enzyme
MSRLLSLTYAGVDLLFTSDREWVVIEVNDHPIGITRSHAINTSIERVGPFSGDPTVEIANLMKSVGGRAIMLLPEYYRITTSVGKGRKRIENIDPTKFDDSRIQMTIEDFNGICATAINQGVEITIADITQIKTLKGEVRDVGGITADTLFRRHSTFPAGCISAFCINDVRQRKICGDKLLTYDALNAAGVPTIPTHPWHANGELLQFLEAASAANEEVILKPRHGSASQSVRRLPAAQALEELNSSIPREISICQPWIQSATVEFAPWKYYFDVRIYVVDGKAVTGFARRGAAPNTGPTRSSPLSWLTTTGPTIPIAYADETGGNRIDRAVCFSHDEIDELLSIAEAAVRALDNFALGQDHCAVPALNITSKDMGPNDLTTSFVELAATGR